ncbi:hypothetical protein ABXV18_24695 [Vibrio owensii]|uniref:hypothetical protein n=1 Tax=Vibrio owensii TaxID=696485 RepID=UPI003395ECB2
MNPTIELFAFVHPIESQSRGVIYAALNSDIGVTYLSISSADATGRVQVIPFENKKVLMNDAEAKCRFVKGYVRQEANDGISKLITEGHQQMLIGCLTEQHPHLFGLDDERAMKC